MIKLPAILGLITSATLISSCVNTTVKSNPANETANQDAQTYTACEKINALVTAYSNDFQEIKLKVASTPISQRWTAKYNLVGKDCHIVSWGNQVTTYSCRLEVPSEDVAQEYFDIAKSETTACIGDSWKVTESPSNNEEGLRVAFDNPEKGMSISAQMVPAKGLFKTGWSVHYYIGDIKQPY